MIFSCSTCIFRISSINTRLSNIQAIIITTLLSAKIRCIGILFISSRKTQINQNGFTQLITVRFMHQSNARVRRDPRENIFNGGRRFISRSLARRATKARCISIFPFNKTLWKYIGTFSIRFNELSRQT